MVEIIWYKSAVVQLRQILIYGSKEFGKSAAIKLYRKIRKSVRLIANNPQMGSMEQLFAKQPESDIRSFTVHKDYKLVYKADIKDDKATAELARILPRCSVIINEHRQQVGRINSLPVFYISIIPVVERKFSKL